MTKQTLSQYRNSLFEQSIIPLIGMFNMCPTATADNAALKKSTAINGLKKGYLIHPNCKDSYANAFLDTITTKYNSTFYKTWEDVTNKSRLELFVDQILHYMTTYGTDFTMDEGYIPNVYDGEPAITEYKVIKSCTFKELYDKCMSMLTSGIALKSETVSILTTYIIMYCRSGYGVSFGVSVPNVDSIKNREALVVLCNEFGIMPTKANQLLSYIVYKTTGETMIIKNRELRHKVRNNLDKSNLLFKQLNEQQMISLASIFNRYKKLFVSFKSYESKRVINKIARLSKKYHKPMKRGFWETVLTCKDTDAMGNTVCNYEQAIYEATKATNFKLLQVMQSIRERLLKACASTTQMDMYIIRNGSVFVSDANAVIDVEHWNTIYNICKEQLVSNLSKKACSIVFPKNYTLTCPTSEKNFIGNFPMGSYCKLGQNSVVGIYWENSWGTSDFDLSYKDINGNTISWCSDYYSQAKDVIYSGDITNAPNGANELLFFKNENVPNGMVQINRYNGESGSKYKLFFATDNYTSFKKFADKVESYEDSSKYMVDPNNICLEAEITQGTATQQTIGTVINGNFYFYSLSCGNARVAQAISFAQRRLKDKSVFNTSTYEFTTAGMIDILKRKAMSFVPLKEILLEAGFTEATDENVGLDLTTIDRSTLIELFSNN